jgi:hypothetical protein
MPLPARLRAAAFTTILTLGFGALAAGDLPARLWRDSGAEQPPRRGPANEAQRNEPPQAPRTEPLPQAYPGGAFDVDCSHVGKGLGGPGYQFIATCPVRSVAPNGRWAVEQTGGEAGGVSLTDAEGEPLDDLPQLMDGMPFVLFWSPRSDWFLVNHYQGSTMDQLRVFQIVNREAIERSAVFAEATRIMVERNPCLARAQSGRVYASGWRWSRDGRRIALVAYAHPAACIPPVASRPGHEDEDVETLWMIGEAASGRIDPASVRERPGGLGDMPADGPYAGF